MLNGRSRIGRSARYGRPTDLGAAGAAYLLTRHRDNPASGCHSPRPASELLRNLDAEPGALVTSPSAYRAHPVRGKGRSPPGCVIAMRTFFQPAVRTTGITRKEGN